MTQTTQPTTERTAKRALPRQTLTLHADGPSTTPVTIGDASVELGQRTYRVVLNCRNTDETTQTAIHGSGDGTTPYNPTR